MQPTQDEIIQTLKDLYANVPESLQKAIMSSDYQRKLVEIGKKNNLTISQLGDLELITTFVMLGATSPNSYQHELEEKLGITDTVVVGKIVDEVNTDIFAVIREELKEINDVGEEDDQTENNEVSSIESDTLKKSGIEIETPKVTPVSAPVTISSKSSPLQSRANILNGIENPTSGKPSFVKEQLSGTFSLPKKETTYTPVVPSAIPNPPIQTAQNGTVTPKSASSDAPVKDPYREIV